MDALIQSLSAQGGILGTLLAISIILVGILGRLLLAEKDKRIQDAVKNRDEIVEPLKSLSGSVRDMIDTVKQSRGNKDGS
jgi:hypothetical protein